MTRIDAATAARLGVKGVSGRRSDPEEELATHLRQLQFPPFEREHVFHATRKWRFDFAWPALRVAVEVEGGLYPMKQADGTMRTGRHTSPKAFEQDAEKYFEAAMLGWIVVRVTPKMVKDGRAYDSIARAVKHRRRVIGA